MANTLEAFTELMEKVFVVQDKKVRDNVTGEDIENVRKVINKLRKGDLSIWDQDKLDEEGYELYSGR